MQKNQDYYINLEIHKERKICCSEEQIPPKLFTMGYLCDYTQGSVDSIAKAIIKMLEQIEINKYEEINIKIKSEEKTGTFARSSESNGVIRLSKPELENLVSHLNTKMPEIVFE